MYVSWASHLWCPEESFPMNSSMILKKQSIYMNHFYGIRQVVIWKVGAYMNEKEHQSIEWKESWQDEYLKWICGYANAYGGTIYIGTDDDGNVVGIDNAKDLLRENS